MEGIRKMANKLKKTEDDLNPRWAKFIELYILTGKAKESALRAGFSENYAAVILNRFPDKVKKSLSEALEARGITSEKVAEKIGVLLDAKKKVRTYTKGDITEEYEEEDHAAIDKGITHAAKIGVGGGYAAEKSVNLTLTAEVMDDDSLQKLAQKLNELHKGNGQRSDGADTDPLDKKVQDQERERQRDQL